MDYKYDYGNLQMKVDADNRPLYVVSEEDEFGRVTGAKILLETFSPIYQQAYDFIIAIAEPITRPEFIHEYRINQFSLYAAASIGLSSDDMLSALRRLSKHHLEPSLEEFIKTNTERCGKLRIVLKDRRYFVESNNPKILRDLKLNPDIGRLMKPVNPDEGKEIDEYGFYVETMKGVESINKEFGDQNEAMGITADSTTSTREYKVHSFEVYADHNEAIRKKAQEIEFPMLEEYDFRNDKNTPNLDVALKPIAKHRPYQQKSLSKMFGNGRARSGIIVLPCGAGKTLVGITACCTIKKSCLIFANTGVSVGQWAKQVCFWTNLPSSKVIKFTADHKQIIPNGACVVVTTYSMFGKDGKRSAQAQPILDKMMKMEWGLVILDEVHVAPANSFRKCVGRTHSRCKLGLTATLVREDDKISDLYYLVGPKLYEANWLDLQRDGYLAKPQCIEVLCPMPYEFYRKYLDYIEIKKHRTSMMLYEINPTKFRTCEYLIKTHLNRGDKVLVFSDNIVVLEFYAKKMKHPFIYGKTADYERQICLKLFNNSSKHNCLFISSVGDTSIDLPDVNVLIQLSSHYGSRRQEAQRLGRILRPKPRHGDEYNAFFYSLVSQDTKEMEYSQRRRTFLMNQGYSVHVVTDLVTKETPGLSFEKTEEQTDLLAKVVALKESAQLKDENPNESQADRKKRKKKRKDRLTAATLDALTGNTASYDEFNQKQKGRKRKRKVDFKNNSLNNLRKKVRGDKDADLLGLDVTLAGDV